MFESPESSLLFSLWYELPLTRQASPWVRVDIALGGCVYTPNHLETLITEGIAAIRKQTEMKVLIVL